MVQSKYVTVNAEQELYVIPCGGGYTCLGFDVCLNRSRALRTWLEERRLIDGDTATNALTKEVVSVPRGDMGGRGTIEAYEYYQRLNELAAAYCVQTGKRCEVDLTPQLIGLEGKQVEVIDSYDERRQFIVGRSAGWMPIHLEIANQRPSGGTGVTGAPFKSVRVVS